VKLDGIACTKKTHIKDNKPIVQRKENRITTNLAVAQLGTTLVPPSCSAEEAPAYVAIGNNDTANTCDRPCNQKDDLHTCKLVHKNKDGQ